MNWTEYWGRRYRYWVHTRECRDFIGSLNYSSYTWFYIIESALLVVVQTSHTIPEGMVVFSKMYHTEKYIYKETDWWLSQSCQGSSPWNKSLEGVFSENYNLQPPISLEEKFVLAGHSMTTHYQHIWGFNIMWKLYFENYIKHLFK